MDTSTLSHFAHASGAYLGCTDPRWLHPDLDSPDSTLRVTQIEEEHPFWCVQQALVHRGDKTVDAVSKNISDQCEQNITEILFLLTNIPRVTRYLAIPFSDSIFIVDLWDTLRSPKERRYRFYLEQRNDKWKIRRVSKLMPCDLSFRVGEQIREGDEYTFSNNIAPEKADEYSEDIPTNSGTAFFIRLLKIARASKFDLFNSLTTGGDHWLALILLQSLQRIVSVVENRFGVLGVSDSGSLIFQHCSLDIIAVGWEGDLFDWQVQLFRSDAHSKWKLSLSTLCG